MSPLTEAQKLINLFVSEIIESAGICIYICIVIIDIIMALQMSKQMINIK